MSEMVLPLTVLYTCLNISIMIVMVFVVVHHRINNQVEMGSGGIEMLARAIRAHGNLSENIPVTLILFALLELNSLPVWQLHLLGASFTAARLTHIHGMLTATLIIRSMGALFTAIIMASMIGLLAVRAVSG